MTKLLIENLEIYGYHGVYDFEKTKGQPFVLNCQVKLKDQGDIADDLADTISYVDVLDTLVEGFSQTAYDLVEYAAQEICRQILALDDRIEEVCLRIMKTDPPVEAKLSGLGVEVCRSSI